MLNLEQLVEASAQLLSGRASAPAAQHCLSPLTRDMIAATPSVQRVAASYERTPNCVVYVVRRMSGHGQTSNLHGAIFIDCMVRICQWRFLCAPSVAADARQKARRL